MTVASQSIQQPAPQSLGDHVKRTFKLALPVTLSRAGMIILITSDTIMSGHASASDLAYYGLSLSVHMPVFVMSLGVLTGVAALVSVEEGSGQRARSGPIWKLALIIGALLGVLAGAVMLMGEELLSGLGHEASLAAGAGATLDAFALGMPALLIFITTSFFLEARDHPVPVTVVALSANVLNIFLNWLMVEGNLGFEAQGAAGAALATSITRWVMAAVIVAYVMFRMPGRFEYGTALGFGDWSGARAFRILRIGLPYGIAVGFESLAFATVTNMAGLMGEKALAVYQASFNITAIIFMISLGFMVATSVRVGNAVGRGDGPGRATAGFVGMGLLLIILFVLSVAILTWRETIAGFYSENPEIIEATAAALIIVAAFIIVDGIQAVFLGALRGTGDVVMPTVMHLFSFWAVAVPAAWLMGLKLDFGVYGLLFGMMAGLLSASVLLSARFWVVTRRPVRRF